MIITAFPFHDHSSRSSLRRISRSLLSLRWSGGPEVERWDPEEAYQASFDGVIAHFVEALRSGAPFETSATENLATLTLVDDVYRLSGWAEGS